MRLSAAQTDSPVASNSAPVSASGGRMAFVDLLRAVASQLIVLHHLAFYGPLSDIAYPLAPAVIDWLFEYGRMAVQVFFVVGGLLAARAMKGERVAGARDLAAAVWHRYRRIGLPYLVTLALAIAGNALASRWMVHESISAPPTAGQLLAHALFLQKILGYESLTAGIWYLAVDFQLGLLVLFVAAACARLARALPRRRFDAFALTQCALWPLAVASLFAFNRDARFEDWAVYFFGSFFVGMTCEWALSRRLRARYFALYLALTVGAGLLDWRPRLLVSAATGLAIFTAGRAGLLWSWPRSRAVAFLGRVSYSVFLVHFPVCLVVNAWFTRGAVPAPGVALLGMALAYALSVAAGVLFHFAVEARFAAPPRREPRPVPSPAAPP